MKKNEIIKLAMEAKKINETIKELKKEYDKIANIILNEVEKSDFVYTEKIITDDVTIEYVQSTIITSLDKNKVAEFLSKPKYQACLKETTRRACVRIK